uniref:Rv3235 family protein n=1 Tax=unclassified Mycolicibacterium TaxID=2636767 RepID=UPI0024E08C00|nr:MULTISPECIES: Rv3235 family protein [unclassified Mycolicibacterium]
MNASATLQQMSSIRLDRWRAAVTASRIPTRRTSFTSPVVDCEPPPRVPPTPSLWPRRDYRPLRSVPATATVRPHATEPPPPRAAAVFADVALRRVLEVTDRRRPVVQLRAVLAPALFDAVAASTRTGPREGAAVLRRVRLRSVEVQDGEASAVEVFASYSRGRRVRAIAGRIEIVDGRWVVTALQIG